MSKGTCVYTNLSIEKTQCVSDSSSCYHSMASKKKSLSGREKSEELTSFLLNSRSGNVSNVSDFMKKTAIHDLSDVLVSEPSVSTFFCGSDSQVVKQAGRKRKRRRRGRCANGCREDSTAMGDTKATDGR